MTENEKTDDELAEELSFLSYLDLQRLREEINNGADKYEAIDRALSKNNVDTIRIPMELSLSKEMDDKKVRVVEKQIVFDQIRKIILED